MRKPPLFSFNQQRPQLIKQATDLVCDDYARRSTGLEYVLNEAAFHEIERLSRYGGDPNIGEVGSLGFWRGLARTVGKASSAEKNAELRRLVAGYLGDIAGNFDPKVYRFANNVLPRGLSLLFNSVGDEHGSRTLRDRIQLQGDFETLRRLAEKGTLVVAPTHSSNLDSIVVGWALNEVGLPPVTYGAGKNLFSNKLLSFFMHNLGAYKVDRRIRHQLYKTCLKMYSETLLRNGYHSLFFPGGTRSRSNKVEQHLKLGLLGTSLTASIANLQQGRPNSDIYVVPVTINFSLVLEAEGLVDDYLRQVGKEYYLLPNDPFDSPMEVARFATRLAAMRTSMIVRFGAPLDVLGNRVDTEGYSLDPRGRRVEVADYLRNTSGRIVTDAARDREFTRQAGKAVAQAFVENTIVMPTNFIARVLVDEARRTFPDLDMVRVLRFAQHLQVPWNVVNTEAGKLKDKLLNLRNAGKIRLSREVEELSVPELIDEGLKALAAYHSAKAAVATGQGVQLEHMNLLLFYANRLECLEGLR